MKFTRTSTAAVKSFSCFLPNAIRHLYAQPLETLLQMPPPEMPQMPMRPEEPDWRHEREPRADCGGTAPTEPVLTPSKGGWREFVDRWCPQYASHAKILNGSIILLIGSVFVSLANFGYNIGVARLLGPSDFSHAAAAVTILMLISAITLAFQLVCTKLVAKADTMEAKAAVFQHLMKRAWAIGFGLGAFMLLASSVLTAYLRLSSPWIIILLTVGLTIYVPLGVKRGGLQGTCRFRGLAWNMAAEAIMKFIGAIVLIEFGFGVLGAVAAISASVIFAFRPARQSPRASWSVPARRIVRPLAKRGKPSFSSSGKSSSATSTS